MSEIKLEHKIPLVGENNREVYVCPGCKANLLLNKRLGSIFDNAIGLADSYIGIVLVVECPVCFTKWYCHGASTASGLYDYFMESVNSGENKHFKE